MSVDCDSNCRQIPIFRILPGARETELICLEVRCGSDPEKPPITYRFRVDKHSSFGRIAEDTESNGLEIQKIERWGQPETDEIDYTVMPLNQVRSLQGDYAPLDQNGKRRLDRLVTICLDD